MKTTTELCYPASHGVPHIKRDIQAKGYKPIDAKYSKDEFWVIVRCERLSFIEKFIKQLRSR